MEKLARIYDDEVLPVWAERFGRMLLRGLDIGPKSQVLDVACGTGYPAVEILRRMDDTSRLIAIDASSAMLDIARKKVEELGHKKGVFFRTENAAPRLSFADDVYDLVVCNLGLTEMPSIEKAIADFARVTVPGGEVRCTVPLRGTFEEFFDIYREVLIKHDKHEALDRLNAYVESYPTAEELDDAMRAAGLRGRVDVEEFSMLFKSSREFFFAPVIEYGPLAEWKLIAGKGQEMQDVFWYIKEAIDAYFGGRAFQVTVKAACVIGTVADADDDEITGQVARLDDDDFEPHATPEIVELPLEGGDAADSIVEEMPIVGDDVIDENTAEIDLAEIEEIADLDEREAVREIELDAFVEGRERPPHLDED